MQYRVDYSPEFLRDLDEIWMYIYEEYQDPDSAERITDGIVDAAEILHAFPYSGQAVLLPGGMDSGYRMLVFEGYVISYRISSRCSPGCPRREFIARLHEGSVPMAQTARKR